MKAKKFSRKLLALFLAVLMAMSCFSGAMVASAANASANTKYHDQDLDFNSLGWPILNDEQACTALLDFVDLTLAQANIAPMNIDLSVLGSITIKLGSVDEVLKTVQDLDSFLNSKSALLLLAGDARYVDLSAVDGMSRSAVSYDSGSVTGHRPCRYRQGAGAGQYQWGFGGRYFYSSQLRCSDCR